MVQNGSRIRHDAAASPYLTGSVSNAEDSFFQGIRHIGAFRLLRHIFCRMRAVGSALPPKPTPAPVTWVDELYVSESGLNRVESLDVTTGKSLATIPVGVRPTMMVYDEVAPNFG